MTGTSAVLGLRRALEHDARIVWGVSARRAWIILATPLIGAVLMLLIRTDFDLYVDLANEDGFLEWFQVAGYLLTFAVGVSVAHLFWRRGDRFLALFFFVFSLGAFFVAGEEISWGQRVFDVATPESFAEINRQSETTIHNIRPLIRVFSVIMLSVGLFGSAGAWYFRLRKRSRAGVWEWIVPPLFLSSFFFLSFADELLQQLSDSNSTLFPVFGEMQIWKFSEWPETCMMLALLAFAVLTRRRLTKRSISAVEPERVEVPGARERVDVTDQEHNPAVPVGKGAPKA